MISAANTGGETIVSSCASPASTVAKQRISPAVSLANGFGQEQQALEVGGLDGHSRAHSSITTLEHQAVVNAPDQKLDPCTTQLVAAEVVVMIPKHLLRAME